MFNRQTQGKLQMINRGNNLLGLEITPAFSYAIPPLLKILTQVQTIPLHSKTFKNQSYVLSLFLPSLQGQKVTQATEPS